MKNKVKKSYSDYSDIEKEFNYKRSLIIKRNCRKLMQNHMTTN